LKVSFSSLSILVLTLFFFKNPGQTNNPGAYCVGSYSYVPCSGPGPPNAGGNAVNDFLDSLYTTGANQNLSTISPGCNGLPNNYIYNCNQYLECSPGQTVQLHLKSGNPYAQAFFLFIDWNQNFQFDLPSEYINFASTHLSPGTWTSIALPVSVNVLSGIYRMRIRSSWHNIGAAATPCGAMEWGETEDYNISIGSVVPVAPTSATASSNYSICSGQSATLQLQYNGSTPSNFLWSGPSSFVSSLQNISLGPVPVSSTGFYHCAMGTSTCPLLASTYLWVQSTPTLQISTNYTSICVGNTIQLSSSGYSAVTWQPGGSNNTNLMISPNVSTIYTLTAQPAYGCQSSQTIGITVKPNFTVQIAASSTLICAGETLNLQASGAEFYLWSIPQTGPQVIYQPGTSTVVTVTGSGSLCSASSSLEITVDVCEKLIESPHSNFKLSYPNPFQDVFSLQSQTPVEISFFSIDGKKLFSLPESTEFRVETSGLASGIYLISISNARAYTSIKVIKD
jgi:GEVED domain/Secretion system C-terminal sorting domain